MQVKLVMSMHIVLKYTVSIIKSILMNNIVVILMSFLDEFFYPMVSMI